MSSADPATGSFQDLPLDEPWPGVRRRHFDSQEATISEYDFDAGAEFPLHSHPQEQVTLVQEGGVELTVGDSVRRLEPGDWSVIPPDMPHGIRAGSDGARFVAIVVPRRQSPHAYTIVDRESSARVQVLGPDGPSLKLVDGEGSARALVWPGVGARLRSMHLITLGPRARTRAQRHEHEAVYYVIAGTGAVGPHAVEEGSMVHVAPRARYVFEAGEGGLELVGGPSPADEALYGDTQVVANGGDPDGIRLFHRDRPDVMMPMIASDARLVVWIGAGARDANMNYVSMQPGEENVPHAHSESEDTIYILSGRGSVDDLTHGFTLDFEAGQAIQVPPGVEHRVKADRGSPVVSVGGPCPSDVPMLKAIGVLPADFES